MQNALIKLTVSILLIGMLIVSCATTSSTTTPEKMASPESSTPPESSTSMAAAEPATVDDQAARRQYEIERNRFIYEDIFFAKNKYQLDDRAREQLDWKAQWLRAHPQVEVVIEGHCGEGGRSEHNLALGLRRAGEVKGYLIRQGVARERLTAVSYGSEQPLVQGKGEAIQAQNRRVRLVIDHE
jgi:peptidoglycan-associated lipoprotein